MDINAFVCERSNWNIYMQAEVKYTKWDINETAKGLVWHTMKIHLNPFERVQIVHFI